MTMYNIYGLRNFAAFVACSVPVLDGMIVVGRY